MRRRRARPIVIAFFHDFICLPASSRAFSIPSAISETPSTASIPMTGAKNVMKRVSLWVTVIIMANPMRAQLIKSQPLSSCLCLMSPRTTSAGRTCPISLKSHSMNVETETGLSAVTALLAISKGFRAPP